MKKSVGLLLISISISLLLFSQSTKRVLFLGNSYTGANNLPQIVSNIAASMGDTMIFDMNVPGGYTLQGHSSNITSINKIKMGNWNFVVLQEQSQLPSFSDSILQADVFPFAAALDSMINAHNPCAETIFYMTWGRKNGDASNCGWWPPVCTYQGMDSVLYASYMRMAYDNNAAVSPVGRVWKYIRQNYPAIELYQGDGSHPSTAGSYAAACCFYTSMFRKDPTAITYNYTLSTADAANIRAAVKRTVFDSLLNWQIGAFDPQPGFTSINSSPNEITFTNTSINAVNYFWNFGDSNTSSVENPVHVYSTSGDYLVKLTANYCNDSISITKWVTVNLVDSSKQPFNFYPNPVKDFLYIDIPEGKIQQLAVYTTSGQRVLTKFSINLNHIALDLRLLSPGIYFVSIIADNRKYARKIIKE